MKNKKTLICLTASYPFGNKETFFENELPYLSKAFDSVWIFPTYNPSNNRIHREVPSNVIVFKPFVSSNKIKRAVVGLLNFSNASFFLEELFEKKVYRSRINFLKWFNSFLIFQSVYKQFKKRVSGLGGDCLVYSYWAEAPIFLTRECQEFKKIVRMHRTDFYLNVNHNYLPLRKQIYDKADLLVPISKDIYDILISNYNIRENKIFTNHLGVDNDSGAQKFSYNGDFVRIVSCSRVDPIKRVDLIAKGILNYRGNKILEWHHFGDGKDFEALENLINGYDMPENIKIVLHGWTDQQTIYKFYQTVEVNWFINVSLHEGVPVSIMEALSFGIPVIATNVGATSESVDDNNGFLLPVSLTPDDLLNKITYGHESRYLDMRLNAFKTWKEKFVGKTNYLNLVNKMREIC